MESMDDFQEHLDSFHKRFFQEEELEGELTWDPEGILLMGTTVEDTWEEPWSLEEPWTLEEEPLSEGLLVMKFRRKLVDTEIELQEQVLKTRSLEETVEGLKKTLMEQNQLQLLNQEETNKNLLSELQDLEQRIQEEESLYQQLVQKGEVEMEDSSLSEPETKQEEKESEKEVLSQECTAIQVSQEQEEKEDCMTKLKNAEQALGLALQEKQLLQSRQSELEGTVTRLTTDLQTFSTAAARNSLALEDAMSQINVLSERLADQQKATERQQQQFEEQSAALTSVEEMKRSLQLEKEEMQRALSSTEEQMRNITHKLEQLLDEKERKKKRKKWWRFWSRR